MRQRKNITLVWLEKRHACQEARLAFVGIFGGKAKIKSVINQLHAINRSDWTAWLLSQELSLTVAMVKQGADIHSEDGYTLCLAAHNGRLPLVKYLVGHGVNIHTDDDDAFCLAAGKGHLSVVKYLFEQGANIHANNDSALCWAAEKGHFLTVKYLVEHGADIRACGMLLIYQARAAGRIRVANFLERALQK